LPGQAFVFETIETVPLIGIDEILNRTTETAQTLYQPVGLRPGYAAVIGPLMDLQGNPDSLNMIER